MINKIFIFLLVIFSTSIISRVTYKNKSKSFMINYIMQELAIQEHFDQLGSIVEGQLIAHGAYLKKRKLKLLKYIVRKEFTKTNILIGVKKYFHEKFDQQKVHKIIDFYESKLARKMKQYKLKAKKLGLIARSQELNLGNVPLKQQTLIKKLIQGEKTNMLFSTIASQVSGRLLTIVNSILPQNKRMTKKEIVEIIVETKKIVEKELEIFLLQSTILIYRNASEQQLHRYTVFFYSKAGLYLKEIIFNGLVHSLDAITEKSIKKLTTK